MILNRTNLGVVQATVIDKTMPLLDNIHITRKGETIGANAETVVIVSPASDETSTEAYTVSSETIKEILKALPSNTKFKDLIDIVEVGRIGEKVTFGFNDGQRVRSIDAKLYPHEYMNYKELLARELSAPRKMKVVFSKSRWEALVETLEKIYKEKSPEFPLFIEFTEKAMIVRMAQPKTGQRIIAIMLMSESVWLEENEWELSLHPEKPKMLRRIIP